jgi:hypothetical protein
LDFWRTRLRHCPPHKGHSQLPGCKKTDLC